MKYFSQFPLINYDITGLQSNYKAVVNIWRRVKVRSKIINQIANYDRYDVQEGESPEIVSYKVYGDTDLFWIVCLMNDVQNRYYDWPLPEFTFQQFVADKYDNPDGIHHYEITQKSGKQSGDGPSDYSHKLEVNSTEPGAVSVSNIQYERRIQDDKRQIKLLPPNFVNAFVDEFRNLINS
tara:strand:- start:2717 stop:3256 length:540 start_codon:yes stop_codon:yes gene_type:complete